MKEDDKNRRMADLVLELLDGERVNKLVLEVWEKADPEVKKQIAKEIYLKVSASVSSADLSAPVKYDRDRVPHPLQTAVQGVWQSVIDEAAEDIRATVRARIAEQREAIVQGAVDSLKRSIESTLRTSVDRLLRTY